MSIRGFLFAVVVCIAACDDDTTPATTRDLAVCVPGGNTAPCPSCLPRSGDPCPPQLAIEGRVCQYGGEEQTLCRCGGEATWFCAPLRSPHD